MSIIEILGQECELARAVIIVGRKGVYYAVEAFEADEHGRKLWLTHWSETVLFSKHPSYRPGGFAFRRAAQEQDRILRELAGKGEHYERSNGKVQRTAPAEGPRTAISEDRRA